jgi:hypothetical protein
MSIILCKKNVLGKFLSNRKHTHLRQRTPTQQNGKYHKEQQKILRKNLEKSPQIESFDPYFALERFNKDPGNQESANEKKKIHAIIPNTRDL